jgi:uncharacterized membrane protein YjjP (DUF1212 family)
MSSDSTVLDESAKKTSEDASRQPITPRNYDSFPMHDGFVTPKLLEWMLSYGRSYLASGGPTSRLEESLTLLGAKYDHHTEVFATPTGIFITCKTAESQRSETSLARIEEAGINLGKLCFLEEHLDQLLNYQLKLDRALEVLKSPELRRLIYPRWQTVLAAFLGGAAFSYSGFQNPWAALGSGLIAVITWWVCGLNFKVQLSSSVFKDFLGSIVAFGLTALTQLVYPASFEALSIGALILLVPGLSLTTAISELADNNLVSGTAKFMQSLLTLLSMGLAYLLFRELSAAFDFGSIFEVTTRRTPSFWVSFAAIFVSILSFSVIFRVPLKYLLASATTGVVAWSVLYLFTGSPFAVGAPFLGALSVGLISLSFGQLFKCPSQVFSVPGVLALLPGMLALSSFQSLALGEQQYGIDLAFKVALTASSIVFGLFVARIPFAFRN